MIVGSNGIQWFLLPDVDTHDSTRGSASQEVEGTCNIPDNLLNLPTNCPRLAVLSPAVSQMAGVVKTT